MTSTQQAEAAPEAPAAGDAQWTAALTAVTAQVSGTDAKSAALLTGLGLPLAVLTAAVQGRELSTPVTVLVGLGGGALVVALLLVLMAIRPALPPGHAARGSFLYWAECTPAQLAADVAAASTRDHRVTRIQDLSRLALRKHRLVRRAIHVTIAGLLLLGAALVAGLV